MLIETLCKQYQKRFAIIKEAIEKYDEHIWDDCVGYKSPTWMIVYHALFYTNIYCSSSEKEIEHWEYEREGYNDYKVVHDLISKGDVISYSKKEMLEYSAFIESRIDKYLSKIEPEKKCWPFWYDETQLEFHINNLRHLQHHIGEIIERHDIKMDLRYIWK
jgi:hypothetical protein